MFIENGIRIVDSMFERGLVDDDGDEWVKRVERNDGW